MTNSTLGVTNSRLITTAARARACGRAAVLVPANLRAHVYTGALVRDCERTCVRPRRCVRVHLDARGRMWRRSYAFARASVRVRVSVRACVCACA
eukprot:3303489-Pleurochrysis_carterae.AAC.1